MISLRDSVGSLVRFDAAEAGLSAWIFTPHSIRPGAAPLVAIHGKMRRAKEQAIAFSRFTARAGRPVIAPLFSEEKWPRYQLAVRSGRADRAFNALMRRISAQFEWSTTCFHLFGFSGGGQFAHRYAMLYPERLRSLSVCAAGWYTFPDDTPFPQGQGGQRWGRRFAEKRCAFLALPKLVAVGELDRRRDPNVRRSPQLDAQQGLNRFERAERWHGALNRAAADCRAPGQNVFEALPAAGHSFSACAASGLCESVASLIERADRRDFAACA